MNVKFVSTNLSKFSQTLINIKSQYNNRFDGTFVGKWTKYWGQLYRDYRDVTIEVTKDCKKKPIKTAIIFGSSTLLWACAKTNPDEISFRDSVLKFTNEIILVSPNLQRESCVHHLRLLEKCYNTKVLRHQSFLFFSIIWVDNYSKYCHNFECNCTYLELPYLYIFKRMIDIGFANKWWLLEKHLENYDVNY